MLREDEEPMLVLLETLLSKVIREFSFSELKDPISKIDDPWLSELEDSELKLDPDDMSDAESTEDPTKIIAILASCSVETEDESALVEIEDPVLREDDEPREDPVLKPEEPEVNLNPEFEKSELDDETDADEPVFALIEVPVAKE